MASCLKYAALHVCQSKNKQAAEEGKVGQGRFFGGREPRNNAAASSCGTPRSPP